MERSLGTNMKEDLTLKAMFNAIKVYHLRLAKPPRTRAESMDKYRDYCLALHAEVTELLDSAPWKPWRPDDYEPTDFENIKEEIVDILFFLGNIMETMAIIPHDIEKKFHEKLEENYNRIERGYSKGLV